MKQKHLITPTLAAGIPASGTVATKVHGQTPDLALNAPVKKGILSEQEPKDALAPTQGRAKVKAANEVTMSSIRQCHASSWLSTWRRRQYPILGMLRLDHERYVWAVGLGWLGLAAAAAGEPIIFSAMGCGPYTPPDKPAAAFYVQQENRERTSEFMVHLGDVFKKPSLKKPDDGAANPAKKPGQAEPPLPDQMPTEAEYRETADLLTADNTIPTWIVPGDNEWSDLEDPAQGWKWWQKYYSRFEEGFQPAWKTERQPERPENFAFVRKGVVFIGINLVGGRIHDASEWALRLPQDAAWIKEVLTRPSMTDVRAAVILCQANPLVLKAGDPKEKFKPFLVPFRQAAADWKKPLLFLHSDGHVWIDDQPWPEKNIRRIQVDKWDTKFPTVQFTVADAGDAKTIFQFNRRLTDPQWKFQPPPTAAGSDR